MKNRLRRSLEASIIAIAALALAQPAWGQFKQQGAKLVGSGAIGAAAQGYSAALAADDATALVGGPFDNGGIGAAWVFIRSGGVWTQQGPKLVGNGAVGNSDQGWSVALSADGNTAIIGGWSDNNFAGATWVFVRSNGVWSQQTKLVATDAIGNAAQGFSVALSSDGNTAIVGGYQDNGGLGAAWVFTRANGIWAEQAKLVGTGAGTGNPGMGNSVSLSSDGDNALVGGNNDSIGPAGATWVFTRSGGVWTQQGPKLVGTGVAGHASQGSSVAMAGEGDIAIVGGPEDNSGAGAAWMFTRSGSTWSQQGSKLVGSDSSGSLVGQGHAVALPFAGHTALVGGTGDNGGIGAVWVYARNGSTWSQQGAKLVGTGAVGQSLQGSSVAISPDGIIALVGGYADNANVGATWVYVSSSNNTATHDFNGDGKSDILWRNTNSDLAIWLMNGTQISSGVDLGGVPNSWSVVGQRDFNGDGKTDLLWRNTNGDLAIWLMNGTAVSSGVDLGLVPTSWSVVGTGDFNGDGKADLLWRNTNGDLAIWLMNGTQVSSGVDLGFVDTSWSVVGTGDFNGDGKIDILWRNTNGDLAIWLMNGTQVSSGVDLGLVPTSWTVVGTGDFNGDGKIDILWRNTNGDLAIWLMNGTQIASGADLGGVPTSWSVAGTGDFNGDGKSDIIWRNTNGDVAIWLMNGATISSGVDLGVVPTSWSIQGANAD
jgi:hypothetical protein